MREISIWSSGSEKQARVWRINDGPINISIIKSSRKSKQLKINNPAEFVSAIASLLTEEEIILLSKGDQ